MANPPIVEEAGHVRLFHAALVWPLQLEPLAAGGSEGRHWEVFESCPEAQQWRCLDDEFTDDPANFRKRHYREFVSFLPYVQRFLYGEGRSRMSSANDPPGNSPVHVFRRSDIARLRLTLRPDQAPVELRVVHLDLYFFHDLVRLGRGRQGGA